MRVHVCDSKTALIHYMGKPVPNFPSLFFHLDFYFSSPEDKMQGIRNAQLILSKDGIKAEY